MITGPQSKMLSKFFKVLGHPFRVKLLTALVDNEACVCHLEKVLGKRQAYISQHLMALREADFIKARREGKYIYYSLQDEELLSIIHSAAAIQKIDLHNERISIPKKELECACPTCTPQIIEIANI